MTTKNSDSESQTTSFETFRLFSSTEGDNKNSGFGFFDAKPPPSIPSPPCIEVFASQASSLVEYNAESVSVGGVTLLKGRVNTQDVFGLSNSDLVPGKYEGGLKLWEGSLDLIKALNSDIKSGHISFSKKRVLELGCGHGLPGIYTLLEGAAVVHFQDFNAEVLRCLTIPNVNANKSGKRHQSSSNTAICDKEEIRFFSGDWSEIDKLLPLFDNYAKDTPGYDFILMAETVYSISSLQNLYNLIKKCLRHPNGVAYMAAKKYYFGVGGGSRRFLSVVEKDSKLFTTSVRSLIQLGCHEQYPCC